MVCLHLIESDSLVSFKMVHTLTCTAAPKHSTCFPSSQARSTTIAAELLQHSLSAAVFLSFPFCSFSPAGITCEIGMRFLLVGSLQLSSTSNCQSIVHSQHHFLLLIASETELFLRMWAQILLFTHQLKPLLYLWVVTLRKLTFFIFTWLIK